MGVDTKEALTKMCEVIGVKYDDIDFESPEWYMKHSWTMKQENEFKEWLDSKLKSTESAKMRAIKVGCFLMNYGWKIKEE